MNDDKTINLLKTVRTSILTVLDEAIATEVSEFVKRWSAIEISSRESLRLMEKQLELMQSLPQEDYVPTIIATIERAIKNNKEICKEIQIEIAQLS